MNKLTWELKVDRDGQFVEVTLFEGETQTKQIVIRPHQMVELHHAMMVQMERWWAREVAR